MADADYDYLIKFLALGKMQKIISVLHEHYSLLSVLSTNLCHSVKLCHTLLLAETG